MKSKIVFVLIGMMVIFGLSVGQAFAQQQSPMAGGAQMEPKAGATGMKAGKEFTGSHRGSKFMDKTVKNEKGENLGEVQDFIFDRDGELSYIVISDAGDSDKMHPIPFTSGMVKFEEDSVVLSNVDKSKLKDAPTFGSEEWNKLDDPTFESRVHGYYREGGTPGELKGGAAGEKMKKSAPEKKD
jgi:sporulation protein YlmC with PRC-barrel domain